MPPGTPSQTTCTSSSAPAPHACANRQPKVLFAEDLAHDASGLTDIVVQLGGMSDRAHPKGLALGLLLAQMVGVGAGGLESSRVRPWQSLGVACFN